MQENMLTVGIDAMKRTQADIVIRHILCIVFVSMATENAFVEKSRMNEKNGNVSIDPYNWLADDAAKKGYSRPISGRVRNDWTKTGMLDA